MDIAKNLFINGITSLLEKRGLTPIIAPDLKTLRSLANGARAIEVMYNQTAEANAGGAEVTVADDADSADDVARILQAVHEQTSDGNDGAVLGAPVASKGPY